MRNIMSRLVLVCIALFALPVCAATATTGPFEVKAKVQAQIAEDYSYLDALYKHLHSHPELSLQEVRTAARLAKELRDIGYAVTENFGGTGIVAVFKNGTGPTVMLRTDLDALPIIERTGLPYASQVRIRDAEGKEVGVMHACGHDIHMTCWVGTARRLMALKDQWKGTVVFIGQPAEERGIGAKAMLDAGLYSRFPKPDHVLALHCDSQIQHGQIGFTKGQAMANVDSVDITVKGKGGHGSAPHTTIDPVVIAARIVLDLQTLVSRELDPQEPGVVTVGSIHGGSKHNIIPAEVKLQITVRSLNDRTRKHLLEGIRRITKAAAAAANAPEPELKLIESEFTPSLSNDPKMTDRMVGTLSQVFGAENILPKKPLMGGEDFSRFAKDNTPVFMFRLGTSKPEDVASARTSGTSLPSLHSDTYIPIPEPSIKTGVLGLTMCALELLGK
jgi:amidohydrolase